jgi:hypothetical protein
MRMESLCLFSSGYHSKEFVDQRNLASNVSFVHPLHLPFPDHVHDRVSLQGSLRCLEGEKAHSRLRQAFDEAMILFDQIVEVFHLPQFHAFRQNSIGSELSNGFGIRGILIDVDHARC